MANIHKMGSSSKWTWVFFCISTSRRSIFINGQATNFFSTSRGLCQGDPLSPSLFILIMGETLGRVVNKAIEVGLLEEFKLAILSPKGLLISHLFADDTLIFLRPRESDMGYLRCIFLIFEAMSRVRLNL